MFSFRLKENGWYTILPNSNKIYTFMSFEMGQNFDNILPILVHLGYVTYKKDRLFIIKKRWQNLNNYFSGIDHFHFTLYHI